MELYWKRQFRLKMKESGIQHEDLARHLNLSVSGVKKIFQKNDIGLDRFNHICRILKIDASDLLREENQNGVALRPMSRSADRYFLENLQALNLYIVLRLERIGLREALEKLKMTKSEAYKHLNKLDRFGLLKWNPSDQIVILEKGPALFGRHIESTMKFCRDRAHELIEEGMQTEESESAYASIRYVSVPPEVLSQIRAQFASILNQTSNRYPPRGQSHAHANGYVQAQILTGVHEGALKPERFATERSKT